MINIKFTVFLQIIVPCSTVSLHGTTPEHCVARHELNITSCIGSSSRWKQRYNVGVRAGTNNAQKIPEDYADLLHTFRKSVITTRKAENIGPADIVNMDQIMCRFDMPPSHTNTTRRGSALYASRLHVLKRRDSL